MIFLAVLIFIELLFIGDSYANQYEIEQAYQDYSKALFQSPGQTSFKIKDFLKTYKPEMNKADYGRFLFLLARSQIMVGDLKQTMLSLNEYRVIVFEGNNNKGRYNYYNLLSGVFSAIGYDQLALQNLEEAYKIALNEKDVRVIRQTEFNIALRYLKLGLLDKAEKNLNGYLEYSYESSAYKKLAAAYTELSELYFIKKDFHKAIELNLKALQIRKKHNLGYYTYLNYSKLAQNYLALNENQNALIAINSARNILKAEKNKLSINEVDLIYAKYLLAEQKYDEAIKQAEKVIKFVKDKSFFEMYHQALNTLIEASSAKLQFKQAFNYQMQQQSIYKDKLLAQQEVAVSYLLDVQDRISKENQIALINFEKEKAEITARNNTENTKLVIIFFVLFTMACLWFFIKLNRKNKELNNMVVELNLTLSKLELTQKQLLENEKMKALTTLVAGMAHQMNTPLSIIKTSISSFKDKLNHKSQQLQSKQLTANSLIDFFSFANQVTSLAEQSSEKTIQLIDRFKRVSAQLDQSDLSTFEFTEFIEETVKTIIETKELNLNYQVEGIAVVVNSYKGCWIKIISQLIENSCTHAFPETIKPEIKLTIQSDDKTVLLIFKDNGKGLSPDELNRVFDPFYTTAISEGSIGLGLNIVYNAVVQMMKGSIDCSSDDKGTGFIIRFPINQQEDEMPRV